MNIIGYTSTPNMYNVVSILHAELTLVSFFKRLKYYTCDQGGQMLQAGLLFFQEAGHE